MSIRWLRLPGLLALAALFVLRAQDLASPYPDRSSKGQKAASELDIKGADHWVDTGIDLKPGDALTLDATGSLSYSASQAAGPEGLQRGWKDLLRVLPINDAGRGALIGRVGDEKTGLPFAVGSHKERKTVSAGRLYLGINQQDSDIAEGGFHVVIKITPPTPADASKSPVPLPAFSQKTLDQIPTRVADEAGAPGDRTNFVIVGPEAKMTQAFSSAGWVQVDRTKEDAVLHGLIASISKQSYTELPMSELYLYGRAQDYGFAHAEPFTVVTTRHHLRLWKAPFQIDGVTVWVGAATHDVGLERDQRNGRLTHKIDSAVDDEREYVGHTLNETGMVAKLDTMTPSHPVTEAKTATGGSFHSDGLTLIVYLAPD